MIGSNRAPLRYGEACCFARAVRDAENSKVLFMFRAAPRAQIARPDGRSQPALARSRMVFFVLQNGPRYRDTRGLCHSA